MSQSDLQHSSPMPEATSHRRQRRAQNGAVGGLKMFPSRCPVFGIPDNKVACSFTIGAAGDQDLAVGADGQACDTAVVGFLRRTARLPRSDVPEEEITTSQADTAPGGQDRSILTERETRDTPLISGPRFAVVPVRDVPDQQVSTSAVMAAATDEGFPIRAESH